MFPVFHLTCVINLSRNKNNRCGLKKVAKSRARVYFEQQILPLSLVFHQTHNLSSNKFARPKRAIRALHFFNPQQLFCCSVLFTLHSQVDSQQKYLLRVKKIQRSDWLICYSTLSK